MSNEPKMPDGGGPAFPVLLIPPNVPDGHYYCAPTPECGMTTRDYFAAAAIHSAGEGVFKMFEHDVIPDAKLIPEIIARMAYQLADAMLAERAKPIAAKETVA